MSLINNMLKDLEKRSSNRQILTYVPLTQIKSNEFKRRRTIIFFISASLATLLFLAIGITLIYKIKTHATVTPMSFNQIKKSSFVFSEENWIKPVLISGLALQVKENVTEITFLLDHAALYRVIKGPDNQFSLIVDHAKWQSEMPPFSHLNTAIKSVIPRVINDDMRFDITLVEDANIKVLNVTDRNPNADIILTIQTPERPKIAENTITSLVPAPVVPAPIPEKKPLQLIKKTALLSQLSQQYNDALNAAENGKNQDALNKLASILKTEPNFKDARVSLIALLIDQGNFAKANKLLIKGLSLAPSYTPFIELKSRLLITDGKIKDALALLQTSPPDIKENPDYHAFMAALYAQTNNDKFAIQLYKQLLALRPNNGNWWFGLGVSLEKTNKLELAVDAYTKALAKGHLNTESVAYLQDRLQKLQGAVHEEE